MEDSNSHSKDSAQSSFVEIMKRAYEKGLSEKEINASKLIEDLKIDLKNMMVG